MPVRGIYRLSAAGLATLLISSGALRAQIPATASASLDGRGLYLPQPGEYGMRILAPDTLELIRINTKGDQDTDHVDCWDFVTNNVFTPPPATALTVKLGGKVAKIASIGFRRRPIYGPLTPRDLRVGNSLIIRLLNTIPVDGTITVLNPDGTLWPSTMTFTAKATVDRFSPALHVNQEGYTSALPKKAMVGYYLGSLGEMPVANGTAFTIVNDVTGAVAYSGTLALRLDVGYTYTPTPYQNVGIADFSALTTPGSYRLVVPGLGSSQPFLVQDSMAMNFARTYALGLYQQRCGSALELPFTRHVHDACHTAASEVPSPDTAYATSWELITGDNWAAKNNPRHTAPRLESEATCLYPYVHKGTIDVSGGHHDAGDYSKYTIDSAQLVHYLVFAADSLGSAGDLDNLGIPESGDGKSDLLQEAKVEADFLAKMQDDDGGFYFLVYPKNRRYEDNVTPDHGDTQVVWPKNTSASAAATAALAQISSSPRFKAQYPVEAAAYKAKALAGWQFLQNAIAAHGKDGAYQQITHYGDIFMHDDELAWAACEIYLATGDPAVHATLQSWYDPSDSDTRRWSWWRLFEGYGCACRSYAFAVRSGRVTADKVDSAYLQKCEQEIQAAAVDVRSRSEKTAYGSGFDGESKRFQTAGWFFSSERAFDITVAQQLAPTAANLDAILTNLNYEAGCNPVNMNYITGLGSKRQREIVHQYARNDRRVLPPSGLPLGNIQAGFAYLSPYRSDLGWLTFPSDGDANTPYPFYDRWGDSFNTTTEFVVVDQARSLASIAWLASQTPAATQAWRTTPVTINLPSAYVPVGSPVTATLSVPGLDLTDARIVWEAAGQEPSMGGTSYTFTPNSVGTQWIEAEVALPDGRRVAGSSSFSTQSASGASEFVLDASTVALYHFSGNYQDSGPNGYHLTAGGNVTLASDNSGWMSAPGGQVARFSALNDQLTVRIPDAKLMPGETAPSLTIEARIYPRAYKAYSVAYYPVVDLFQSWDCSLELEDGKWNNPSVCDVCAGSNEIVNCSVWNQYVTPGSWHLLRMTLDPTGTVTCSVDGTVLGQKTVNNLNYGRENDFTFTLGNFDGDLDEVRISNVVRSN